MKSDQYNRYIGTQHSYTFDFGGGAGGRASVAARAKRGVAYCTNTLPMIISACVYQYGRKSRRYVHLNGEFVGRDAHIKMGMPTVEHTPNYENTILMD